MSGICERLEVQFLGPTRQHDDMTAKAVKGAVIQAPSHDAAAGAILHDEVENEILDVELDLLLQALLIERMQQSVPGSVGGGARPLRRVLAIFLHVAAEGPLIDPAIIGAAEGQPEMLQLQDHLGGVPTSANR